MNAPDKLLLKTANTKAAAGQSHFHESARAQVAGAVNYIDDIPEVKGTLFAAPILSNVAHGRLLGVDATAALAMPGVRGVVLAADVPGDPLLATFVHDEPIFAVDTVQHIGQVIGLVVADSVMQARHAARKVQLHIDALPAVLTVREALAARGIALSPDQVVEKPYTHAGGREGLRAVLKSGDSPTAIICGNDVLAIGAIAECHAQGLKVPDDVSITGFDDMEMASLMTPALTTVRFPTAEMGVYAANHLLARLDDKAVELRNKLPTELIVRSSAAAPKS